MPRFVVPVWEDNPARHSPPPAPRSRATFHRLTHTVVPLLAAVLAVISACTGAGATPQIGAAERRAMADTLEQLVVQAYDFSRPDVASRLLALYPDSGRVISAAAGRVSTTRLALEQDIAGFWERVGQNMRGPSFQLGSAYVDIITRDAAVMTFTYRIPHRTPENTSHIVSGAWTTFWRRENGRWRIVQEHLSDTPESTAPGPTSDDSVQRTTPPVSEHRH